MDTSILEEVKGDIKGEFELDKYTVLVTDIGIFKFTETEGSLDNYSFVRFDAIDSLHFDTKYDTSNFLGNLLAQAAPLLAGGYILLLLSLSTNSTFLSHAMVGIGAISMIAGGSVVFWKYRTRAPEKVRKVVTIRDGLEGPGWTFKGSVDGDDDLQEFTEIVSDRIQHIRGNTDPPTSSTTYLDE